MSQKNFTNATGNWSVRDDGNISYVGGAVGVQELDIESGRLTAYADPIPQYEYDDEPGRAYIWRNPVTGTLLGFHTYTDPIVRSADNGATWQNVESPTFNYGIHVKGNGGYEPGPDIFATNTDGSMVVFGPGGGNLFSTDDGLTWTLWDGQPKGELEATHKILYDEGTDTWRVLGSVNSTVSIMMEFEGSDPNTFLRTSTNFNWAPYSRAMIMDSGQILFKNFSFDDLQPDGTWKATMTLLKDSSSMEDDNIFASYELHLEDTDYSSGIGRPSFNHGKDSLGRNIGAVAYTRSNNTLGIRTTLDGQNWTDLSDQLGDLPLVAQDGIASLFWLEGRQQWIVFVTKIGKSGDWWPQPGDAYVFKTAITGDLTSFVDATYNALVGSRVQYAMGNEVGVWIAPQMNNDINIAIKDITETNPPNLDLYWDGEKLAIESYVNSLVGNVQTDLSNCIKSKVERFVDQSIGGYHIQLSTEYAELGYINDSGNYANYTNMTYLSKNHRTRMAISEPDDPTIQTVTISVNRDSERTFSDGRFLGAYSTEWLKPHLFRDKVEIDLDPTGDFDAANKKYVDSVAGGPVDGLIAISPDVFVGSLSDTSPTRGQNYATLGYGIKVDRTGATAVGWHSEAMSDFATAVGIEAWARHYQSTAIGAHTQVTHNSGIALGKGAATTKDYEFAISPHIQSVNFSGATIQATDFLDADGNSIIGAGGGNIADGEAEGVIAKWDSAANQWVPEPNITVTSGPGALKFGQYYWLKFTASNGVDNGLALRDDRIFVNRAGGAGLAFWNTAQTEQYEGAIVPCDYRGAHNGGGADRVDLGVPEGTYDDNGYIAALPFRNGYFSGEVQATDFLDADRNPLPKSATVRNFVTLTQAQYDLLPSKNGNTIYFIKE